MLFVDTKLMKNLQMIIKNYQNYQFLDANALEAYYQDVMLYNQIPFINDEIVQINFQEFLIFPFLGTKAFITYYYLLRKRFETVSIYFDGFIPLFITIKNIKSVQEIIDFKQTIKSEVLNQEDIPLYEIFSKKENMMIIYHNNY